MFLALLMSGLVLNEPLKASSEFPLTPLPEAISTRASAAEISHRYTMTARIRLLIFWLGKDDVGGGRIAWVKKAGFRAYELLIGSDPLRAPRRINRWGYALEWLTDGETSFVGVMKGHEEDSAKNAADRLAREAKEGRYLFRSIESTARRQGAISRVTYYSVQQDFSYRDLEDLARLAEANPTGARQVYRSAVLPAGQPLGFLAAVDEMIQRTLEAAESASAPPEGFELLYAFNATLYRLTLEKVRPLEEYEVHFRRAGGAGEVSARYGHLLHSRFRVENQRTGKDTRFELIYGASGPLAGVPVQIIYQPKWWFQAVLHLDDDVKSADPF